MKKSLLTLLLCASALMAQPSKMADNGASNLLGQNINFGGNNFLTLGSATDTLSDPIVAEIGTSPSTFRSGTFTAIEFKGIAADSNDSRFRIEVQSRWCTNPTTQVGCTTQWLTRRFRTYQLGMNFADSLYVPLVPQDTTMFSLSTFIPTGNQYRLRVVSVSSPGAVHIRFPRLIGY